MDGSGYPDGLEGAEIPLGARIIGLADLFDTIAFPASAEKPVPIADALMQLKKASQGVFDEALASNFIRFVESNDGQSGSYLMYQDTLVVRDAFAQILKQFRSGQLRPPVVPHVVREIQSVLKRESPTDAEEKLTAAIEKDPVISLRLISIANSPVYRGISEIRNVRAAIPRLGIKETLSLVIAMVQRDLFQTDKVRFKILMDRLWVHSLATGYGAKRIGHMLKLEEPENLFLLGLTHDIGKIFLLKALADILDDKWLHTDAVIANLRGAHSGVTDALLRRWGFDERFIRIICRHEIDDCHSDAEQETLILDLAAWLTRKIGFSLIEDETDIAELDAAKILSVTWGSLDDVGEQVKQTIQGVAHLF
jgi:HD-like signal output (HDOD) protein